MPKRPRDVNQLAKMIVDLSTGECEERCTPAMAANVIKRLWTIDDIVSLLD